jgi:predicted RNase H-like HicB family nuclease
MTRTYSLAIEGAPGSYSAYVPELPTVVVTGNSIENLTEPAREAIHLYWDAVSSDRSPTAKSKSSFRRSVTTPVNTASAA